MAQGNFSNQKTYYYTGSTQYFEKEVGVDSIDVITVGGSGGNNSSNTGGGKGCYIWSQYTNINQDISFNIIVNVGGGGGNATTSAHGVGGKSSDISGTSLFINGGDGTSLGNIHSAGGGAASSIFYNDTPVLICIAGGGGGAGSNEYNKGANAYSFAEYINTTTSSYSIGGEKLLYVGGGNSGNMSGNREGGIGTVYGGCNGYDFYINPSQYRYGIGGGGGDGGYSGSGGGGGGYGGGSGGNYINSQGGGGGGGGGGSFTNSSVHYFQLNETALSNNGNNGYVIISYNGKSSKQQPIIPMYMMDVYKTNISLYYAPDRLPSKVIYTDIVNSVTTNSVIFNSPSTILSTYYGIYTNFNNRIYGLKDGIQAGETESHINLKWTANTSSSQSTIPFKNLHTLTGDGGYIVSADTNDNIVLISDNLTTYSIVNTVNDSNMIDISYMIIDNSDNVIVNCTDNIFVYKISVGGEFINKRRYNIPGVSSLSVFIYNLHSYIVYATKTYIGKIKDYDTTGIDTSSNEVLTEVGEEIITKLNITGINAYFGTSAGKLYSCSLLDMTFTSGWPITLTTDPLYRETISDISLDRYGNLLCVLQNGLYVIKISEKKLKWIMETLDGTTIPNTKIKKCFPAVVDYTNNAYYTINAILYSINISARAQNWCQIITSNATVISNVAISYNSAINPDDGDTKNGIIMLNVLIQDTSVQTERYTLRMYEFYQNSPIVAKKIHVLPMSGYNPAQTNVSNYNGPSSTTTPTVEETAPYGLDIVSSFSYILPSSSVDYSNNVIVSGCGNKIYIVDNSLNTVSSFINVSSDSILSTPSLQSNNTICVNAANKIILLGASGNTRWEYITVPSLAYSSTIVDSSDVIYVGSANKIYAIGDGTIFGYKKWLNNFTIDDSSGNISANITLDVSGNRIIAGTDAGVIYCLSSIEGTLEWSANTTNSSVYAPPCIDSSGNYLIALSKNDNINNSEIRSYKSDGILNWTSSITNSGPVYNGMAYNQSNNTLFVGGILKLFAINCSNGAEVGHYNGFYPDELKYVYFTAPVIDQSNNIYVSSSNITGNGILHCLTHNVSDNPQFTNKWNIIVSDTSRLTWPSITKNNSIFVSAVNGKVYKIK